jgi:hypothetical protein
MSSAVGQTRRGTGAIWIILGLILLLSDSGAGWLFVIIGLVTLSQDGGCVTSGSPRKSQYLTVFLLIISLVITSLFLFLIGG